MTGDAAQGDRQREWRSIPMKVQDLMSKPPVSVSPETPLREVARLLCQHRISGVPVVDEGLVVGVVSESDIVERERGRDESRLLHRLGVRERRRRKAARAATAGDAMSSPAVIADPTMSDYGPFG
jgi:CBS-domain-containing membrane protein